MKLNTRGKWNRCAWVASVIATLIVAAVSCKTIPPIQPADLSAPGWHILQGQAVWKPPASRPELTGELLLATNVSGDMFLQFYKTPFQIAVAQVNGARWRVEFGSGNYTAGGVGPPSPRFAWLVLPSALNGQKPRDGWHFEAEPNARWKLWNSRTGEILEGFLSP